MLLRNEPLEKRIMYRKSAVMRMGLTRPRAKVGKCMSRLSQQIRSSRRLTTPNQPQEKRNSFWRSVEGRRILYRLIRMTFGFFCFMGGTVGAIGIAGVISRLSQRLFSLSDLVSTAIFTVLYLAGFIPGTFLSIYVFGFTLDEARPRWQRWGAGMLYIGVLVGSLWTSELLTLAAVKH